jgi:hypothetical protein
VKAHVTALALAAVVPLSAGCGDTTPKGTGPKEPPPEVPGVRAAPPPAWIETRGGDRWLAFSSYCWSVTCVDSRPVEQRTDVPRIRVVSGEVVRFHLRFRPTELMLRLGSKTYPLKPERVASWRVRGPSGVADLTARAAPGSAGYVARLLVR